MAVSDSFLTFVLEQLAGVPAVSTRRMFGGVGVYSADLFFAIIDNDTLFFKVSEVTVVQYRKRRMPPFRPMPDRPPMTGYFQVPPAIVEDRDALAAWAKDAIGVAAATPKRRRQRPRK